MMKLLRMGIRTLDVKYKIILIVFGTFNSQVDMNNPEFKSGDDIQWRNLGRHCRIIALREEWKLPRFGMIQ
jgi:hypothetical protein